MKFSYNWLQIYFEQKLPKAEEIEQKISLHSFEPEGKEILENDVVFDFDILPNRAHDCLCHRGLALEISALFDIPLQKNNNTEISTIDLTGPEIENRVPDECNQYLARRIENIEIKESPIWLKERLENIGQKSINNVVDATNYVMFDMGQPLHAFDSSLIKNQKIIIRHSQEAEEIELLSGEKIKLKTGILMITDQEGPLSVAGIKGGRKAEVTKNTKSLIIESALFNPTTIRKNRKEIKIQTDSSKRFENEISHKLARQAIEEVTRLIIEIAGNEKTTIGEVKETKTNFSQKQEIILEHKKIEKMLGINYDYAEIIKCLEKINCTVTKKEEKYLVLPPFQRLDLNNQVDLIEEIARIIGYEKIPTTLPEKITINNGVEFSIITALKLFLTNEGWDDVLTYTFSDKGKVEMANALSSEKRFLRTNIEKNLAISLEKNQKNIDLLNKDEIKIFEIGYVFEDVNNQGLNICFGYFNPNKKINFDWENLLSNLSDNIPIKYEVINKTKNYFEIKLSKISETDIYKIKGSLQILEQKFVKKELSFESFSVFPAITRDLSFWYQKDTDIQKVIEIIKKSGKEILKTEPRIVDNFEKDGQKSMALRFVFQSKEKTLTDQEILEIMKKIETECISIDIKIR